MSTLATAATLSFVLIAMLLSLRLKLTLEGDMLVSTIRAIVQLLAIGYILEFIFSSNHPVFIVCVLLVMLLVAAHNSAKRGKGIPHVFIRVLFTITIVSAFTLGIMLAFHMIQWKPQSVIPIGGMIIGNCMIVSSLLLNQMRERSVVMREEILAALSLGATSRQASERLTRESIRAGMIPIIDAMKTVGLVQLPGMMTGLIIAGASPIEAVRYQLLIMFSYTAASALTSIILGFLIYPTLFTRAHQYIGWK
ncbi:iron export ABC transporter permease subunit FetB [Aneurinibacillus sp. BA2021]|nr:iron export ABC transporter permease subunit FetB [Aneurinibacillus sp. BA2021]